MGHRAHIGEQRVWSDSKTHVKTDHGWEEITDPTSIRKRDEKAKIFSSRYRDGMLLSQSQKEFKATIDELGLKRFNYYKLKTDLDQAFGRKGNFTIFVNQNHEVETLYELGEVKIFKSFSIKDGKLDVEHTLMKLPKKMQNKGYAKKIAQTYYRQYLKCGVNRISMVANEDVGGYAWAKYGYVCDKSEIDRLLKKDPEISRKEFQDIVDDFYKVNFESTPFPMRMIANYHDESGKNIGKEALLNSRWEGFLDMTDDKQRIVFEAYLHDEKRSNSEVLPKVQKLPDSFRTDSVFKTSLKDSDAKAILSLKKIYNDSITNKHIKEKEFFEPMPLRELDPFIIHPTKEDLDKEAMVEDLTEIGKPYPYGIMVNGEVYIIDGHERVANEILKNNNKIKVRVYEHKDKA